MQTTGLAKIKFLCWLHATWKRELDLFDIFEVPLHANEFVCVLESFEDKRDFEHDQCRSVIVTSDGRVGQIYTDAILFESVVSC